MRLPGTERTLEKKACGNQQPQNTLSNPCGVSQRLECVSASQKEINVIASPARQTNDPASTTSLIDKNYLSIGRGDHQRKACGSP